MKRVAFVRGLALAACGDDGSSQTPDAPVIVDSVLTIDAVPREVIMVAQPLVPGELVEGIMTTHAGDYAVITLRSPTPEMDWNIHGHANGGTQIVDEGFNQTAVDFVFTPSAPTRWWLLIRNSGPTDLTVDLKVELFGQMTWEWQ